ncbi:MAG: hypothetical protein EB078_04425 [Proteobacteria bacterium]|nr:hypothetical protein [Pseudomonadota bacterium]NDC25023.1 hypothetical protein [Pseudomonadota bacterium]NDD04129.1 hypothetical protein [Pseudomonadota bacterium]NDG25859.1 hypothetical protein [Pseudomonadota bacterium]
MSQKINASEFSSQTIPLDIRLETSYLYQPSEKSERGLLVLHGFTDRAQSVKKRLLGDEPVPHFHVLIPNGLFPCPSKKNSEFKEAYAWYFRDPQSGKQMISPEFAAEALMNLIAQVGLDHLDWTILGFSQGGFFAPFLLKAGLNCNTIIGVGAAYRAEAYEGVSLVKVYGIHGAQDEIVPYAQAKSSFEMITRLGYGAKFFTLPDLGHSLNGSGRKIVRELLESR